MKKRICFTMLFLLASNLLYAGNFMVFGDSLSDTGNLARFTYNSGKIYNEHLANYFGEEFPEPNGGFSTLLGGLGAQDPPSLIGPNWAQGGSVANTDLGMDLGGISGKISFQTQKQISAFFRLNKPSEEELKNLRTVYWIGGNDMRLVFEGNKYTEYNIIDKSIDDIGKQTKRLVDSGVKFMIVPKVPDISYTPKFLKQFGKMVKINGETLYKEPGWFSSGLSEDNFEKILDIPSWAEGSSHDEIIKKAIEEILKKQKKNHSESEVNKWFTRYKEEKKKLSDLGKYLNEGVDKKLQKLQEENSDLSILRPDISTMITEAVEHPELYGFTNAVGTASKRFSSVMTPFNFGAGTGRDRIASFDPEDNENGKGGVDKKHLWGKGYHYLFADEFHPSPEAHKIIADYMISLLETEKGDAFDESINYLDDISKDQNYLANIKEGNILKKSTTENFVKDYVHYGVLRARSAAKIEWNGLKLANRGIALSAEGENSSIHLSNYYIKNVGMISSAVQIENGGNISLENGVLEGVRGSKVSYPFGIRVNGEKSKLTLKNSKLNMRGKQTVGISVGNNGEVEIDSSVISVEGKEANALHVWEANATLKNSELTTDNGTAIWIFSNNRVKNKSNVSIENTKIQGNDYAIKVSPNITKYSTFATINIENSEINGGILTGKNNTSTFLMQKTFWNMTKDSSITNLALQSSQIKFYTNIKDNFNTLLIKNNYQAENTLLSMRGNLNTKSPSTDLLVIEGEVFGKTQIDYKNIEEVGKGLDYGIKVIDLEKVAKKDSFQLLKPVYSGNYEYVLLSGENREEGVEDFYLTSTIVYKNGKRYVPTNLEQGKKIRLLKEEVSIKSLLPYANIESAFQNIFHLKDRENVFFAISKEEKVMKEEEKSEIKINSSITKFSYPLSEKFGLFFSIGKSNIELYDNTRKYFDKNTQLSTLKYKDFNLGIYYQHSLFKKLYVDHTLQYQWVVNKYRTDEIIKKNHGYGIGYSSLIAFPISLSENWTFEPHYQIDIFYQNFHGYNDYAARNYFGTDIIWNKGDLALQTGIDYQSDLRRISGVNIGEEHFSHHYKNNDLSYKIAGEYSFQNYLKLNGTIRWNEKNKNTSFELGLKYKF